MSGAGEVSRYPWRATLAGWPIPWREMWGRRANELADEGVTFPDDERIAFEEVDALKNPAQPVVPGRRPVAVPPGAKLPEGAKFWCREGDAEWREIGDAKGKGGERG